MSYESLQGRVAVVTGASSGSVRRWLARSRMKVYMWRSQRVGETHCLRCKPGSTKIVARQGA